MNNPSSLLKSLSQHTTNLIEQPKRIGNNDKELYIGIPKTKHYNESRIPLTPESVKVLCARGNKVVIEAGAGEKAGFEDIAYSEAGAEVSYEKKKVYNAHILIKMTPILEDEIELLHANQIILSPIHLPKLQKEVICKLLEKKVITLAFEYIKDEVKNFPLVQVLSEIAGRASVLIAGELMKNLNHGNGLLLGGITGVRPTKVVVLGAGTVGEGAVRASLGFGAEVKLFDDNIYKLRRLQNNLGCRLYTSVLNPDLLIEELAEADVVIGAIHSKIARTPIVVFEEMVMNMKPNAVIIDVSIDQGGIVETSRVTTIDNPTFIKHDIVHYCVPNITSMYPKTASSAISNILTPILNQANEMGGFESYLHLNKGIRKGIYTYKGKLTNEYISQNFQLKYTDLDLLSASGLGC